MLHVTDLLIRWLEDLVVSPPLRPGATPEERADDYLLYVSSISGILCETAKSVNKSGAGRYYAALTDPAKSAWGRLLTQHLPHLPLPARLFLSDTLLSTGIRDVHFDINLFYQNSASDLEPLLVSGNFVLPVGRGMRRDVGDVVASLAGNLHIVEGHLPVLSAGAFVGA
jgi:hypothetical protein